MTAPAPAPVAPTNFDGQRPLEDELLSLNSAWRTSLSAQHPTLFPGLSGGQVPKILWLGCSDSRVPETTLLGLFPGEVFVHRNIANLINPADTAFPAVLRYALKEVKVAHIVLCGHMGCGGCKAVLGDVPVGEPPIDNWLAPLVAIRNAHRAMIATLPATAQAEELAKLNVQRGLGLLKLDPVVSSMLVAGSLQLHGGMYNVGTGELKFYDTMEQIEPAQEPVATPTAALRMGQWKSQWVKGGWQTMVEGDVTFTQAYSTPPQVLVGLFGFDLSVQTRLQFSGTVSNITATGFHMKVQALGDTLTNESAWYWLEIPQDGSYRDFQTGNWSTTSIHSIAAPQTQTSQQVNFPSPYSAPPTVVVSLTGFDTPGGNVPLLISAYATNVTATGFMLHVDGANYAGSVNWLSYPTATTSGVSSALFAPVTGGQTAISNAVFPQAAPSAGASYTAMSCFNSFAFNAGQNFRVFALPDNVTTTGCRLNGGTWGGGAPLVSVSSSYVAIKPI